MIGMEHLNPQTIWKVSGEIIGNAMGWPIGYKAKFYHTKLLKIVNMVCKDREIECITTLSCGIYKSCKAKMTFRCCVCDYKWETTFNNIYNRGAGCPKCTKRIYTENIEREYRKRGFLFCDIIYNGIGCRYLTECIECGCRWRPLAKDILIRGIECVKCGLNSSSLDDIIREYRKKGFLFCGAIYKGKGYRYPTKCIKCGHIWEPSAYTVLRGRGGCPKCARNALLTLEEVKIRYKEQGLIFLSEEYNGIKYKYKARCEKCGYIWYPWAHNVFQGHTCPNCYLKTENAIRKILERIIGRKFPKYSPQMLKDMGIYLTNTKGNQMHIDGYCPNLVVSDQFPKGVAFEYHGDQHTNGDSYIYAREGGLGAFKQRQEDDELKRRQCAELGILLIEIYEDPDGVWPYLEDIYGKLIQIFESYDITIEKMRLTNSDLMMIALSDENQTILDFPKTHIIGTFI